MNISVERGNWIEHNPELVVLVGDPYSDFIGTTSESLGARLHTFNEGFVDGQLRREISFTAPWDDDSSLNFVYYHTSTLKGFTATENLKTFLSKALHMACDTGRKKVALLLKGEQGEGLIEQMVEGSLVGTYSFRDYKKDKSDPFSELELILCLPSPEPPIADPPTKVEVETVAAESESVSVVESIPEAAEDEPEEADSDTTEEKETEEASSEDSPSEQDVVSTDEAESPESEQADGDSDDEAADEPADEPADETSVEEPVADEDSDEEEDLLVAEVPDEVWAALKAGDDSAVQVGQAFGEGVNLARTLVARPAAECTPDYLSRTAKKMSSAHGFSYQAFGPKQLKDHEYAGLVTVGKGADNTPRMIEMTYIPDEESDVHLVLLGKGVTFDSGGISIKGSAKMHLMIGDMAGAAAVLGAMDVLGRLQPSIKVTGLIVSAENKPGSKSYRPGDIIRYKNGTTVHVENTDAEGRLILADGLIRAGELGATHIVDLATLTGACSPALGPSFTGIMGANRKLVNAITRAGGNHGESYWRLPMPLEYKDMLKSVHADINNMGGPDAGATTAALFLKEFVPARTPWVHLDIAGTFWKQKPWKYYKEGPSGTGVKTLADLALRWKEHLG